MDTTIAQYTRNPSNIERTSCGIPNTPTLFRANFGWLRNFQEAKLTTNGELTPRGKGLFHGSNREDWVSELADGTIVAHPDFDMALSVVDNHDIGRADQLQFNSLCRELAMLSLAAGNRKIEARSQQAKTQLEDARTNLENTHKKWSRHFTDIDRISADHEKSQTWINEYQTNTKALAQAAGQLSSLVPIPIEFKTGRGGQSSYAPTTNIRTFPHHENDSLSNKNIQSSFSDQMGGSGSDRVLGGLIEPSGQGDFVNSADYGEEEESSEGASGRRSRMPRALEKVLGRLKKT